METTMIRAGLVLAGAIATMLMPADADAQRWREDVRQVRVDTSALDLSTPAGIEELRRRIHRAVNNICNGDRECRDGAWASTDEQVAWAIERDEWTRRLAAERAAQLRACGWQGCVEPPQPAYYPAPPPPHPVSGVSVTVIYIGPPAPPPGYYGPPPPRHGYGDPGYAPPPRDDYGPRRNGLYR
jgi:UrcA family protein